MGRGLGLRGWGTVAGIVASVATVIALIVALVDGDPPPPAPPPSSTTTSSSDPERDDLAIRTVRNFYAGQWPELWQDLAPAEQDVVSERFYERCQSRLRTEELVSAQVEGTSSAPIHVPGIDARTATVVLVASETRDPDGTLTTAPDPVYMIEDSGSWQLLLNPAEEEAYERGRCPDYSALDEPTTSGGSLPPDHARS
jgi:hypothetical protein